MKDTWYRITVLGLLLLCSLALFADAGGEETEAAPHLSGAAALKVAPDVRSAMGKGNRLKLTVRLRRPLLAEDYASLWSAGARVEARDYRRGTARVTVRPEDVAALASLVGVTEVRVAGAER